MANGRTLSISCDESQDGAKDPIHNYLVAGGRAGPYVRKCLFPTTESQNAANIKSDLEEVIEEIEESTKKPVCFVLCLVLVCIVFVFVFICVCFFFCIFVFFVCVRVVRCQVTTDNCTTMSRARQDWEESTEYGIYGCITHCFNKVNEWIFKLERYEPRIKELNNLIVKLRGCKAGQHLKESILKKRCNNLMRVKYPYLRPNSIQYKIEFDQMVADKKKKDRVGIPTPGITRKWNNMYLLMEFVLENELDLKQLYVVFVFVHLFCFDVCV